MVKKWPLKNLGLTNSIITDYTSDDERIKPYYNHPPSINGLVECAKKRKTQAHQADRNVLIEQLLKKVPLYNDGTFDMSKSIKNINSLKYENTFTITTGQQLHLFLGPAYFINKIFSCIKLVKEFNQAQPDNQAIPVFWLASEDHDIEEISSVELFGQNYSCNLTQNKITGLQDTSQIEPLTKKLEERLGNEADTNQIFSVCKEAYQKFSLLADATAYIIYKLFSDQGIVVIDGNRPEFKSKFNFIAKNEIETEFTTKEQIKVKAEFDAQKWHYQVMPRTNNLFTIDKDGLREPTTDVKFDKNQTYSPNALLRPLYQELILPNIAYIGGAAEVNYWLQLKPAFDQYKVNLPVIWLRDTIHLDSEKKVNQLTQLEISVDELANFKEDDYAKQFVAKNLPEQLIPQMQKIRSSIESIKKDINNAEWISISKEYENVLIDTKKAFRNLKTNILEGNSYKSNLQTLEKARHTFFLKANMQERNKSGLSLSLNYQLLNTLQSSYLIESPTHSNYYLIGK